jgi:dihydrofolate synthase / folylpolyglutamate synthase
VGLGLRTYGDALDFLYARTTGIWRLGLERVEAFLHSLGDPHDELRALHVAGTNGKGSVCATLDAALRAKGLRVAMYTSPHLVDFRERFLINGIPVAPERIVDFVDKWTPEVERLGATFFEATTAMAFKFFAEENVDIAVIETGLGGRLDATNVITPLVAGVSTIDIDHVEYLGATLQEIAFEKAGIFKPGTPAIVGEPDPVIRALLASHAHAHGATPVRVLYDGGGPENIRVRASGTSFTLSDSGRSFETPLLGAHQAANCAVAIAMLDALPSEFALDDFQLRRGLGKVILPGRFQRVGKYLFDVAHNPAGAAVLADTLRQIATERPIVAVLSVLADKDWRGIMDILGPVVDRFVLTNAPTAPPSRTWNVPDPLGYARERGWSAELIRDFDRALVRAAEDAGTVLITGSFHTVGDAMSRLEVSPTGR